MKKTKYLNKNFEIDSIFAGIELLESDDSFLDEVYKSLTEFKDEVYRAVGPDAYFGVWDEKFIKEEKELKILKKKIKGTNFQKNLHRSIFDGSLLTKLSNDFKLEIYFEMKIYSHCLIYSKRQKAYYYITNKRKWDKKNNKGIDELIESYMVASFEKKLSKSEFFREILFGNEDRENDFMERNKKIEYEKREKLWEKTAYVSSKGLDFISLYKEVYDQYVKSQES